MQARFDCYNSPNRLCRMRMTSQTILRLRATSCWVMHIRALVRVRMAGQCILQLTILWVTHVSAGSLLHCRSHPVTACSTMQHSAHRKTPLLCFLLCCSCLQGPSSIADPVLGDTRIILVAPKTPGNIGAVCRAAACFEVRRRAGMVQRVSCARVKSSSSSSRPTVCARVVVAPTPPANRAVCKVCDHRQG